VHDALVEPPGRRRGLRHDERAGRLIDRGEVGERSSDVDRDAVRDEPPWLPALNLLRSLSTDASARRSEILDRVLEGTLCRDEALEPA
jgi:hypothetical protein